MITIVPVQTGTPLEHFIALSLEYITWMIEEIQQQYPELNIAEFTAEHEYDDIRKKFPGEHIPPTGCLLIAMKDEQPAGCVAIGRLSERIGEMRTLFVRPAFREAGIGRKLVDAALNEAQKLNYESVRLDTLGFMEGALNLYASFGFKMIAPYREISASLINYIRFLELQLS